MTTKKSLNLRIRIAFIALSLTGMLSIIVSSWLYQNLVYHEDEIGLSHLTGIKYKELRKNLIHMMTNLGLRLQKEKDFRRAIKKKDYTVINTFLNDEYHQYFVTAEMLNLQKIYLLDKKLKYIGRSSEGYVQTEADKPLCSQISQLAKSRKGIEKLKVISDMCINEKKSFLSIIVPVGTIVPFAYLQIVVDPVFNLVPIERELELELQIKLPNNKIKYESSSWPNNHNENEFIFSEYVVKNIAQKNILSLIIAKPIAEFKARFLQTTFAVLGISGILIAIVFFITTRVFKKGLDSLSQLEKGAHQVSQGNFQILPHSEYWELNNVIQSFNLMSEKIKDSQSTLQLEINEATKDLNHALQNISDKNVKLEIAMQLAEQASETKSTFLANMSHELRTPLNAIIGYSEMLKEDAKSEQKKQLFADLDKIFTSGKHLLNLVNEVLDLSKIEAGKVDIFAEEFNLATVISEIIETTKPLAELNHNNISLYLSSQTLLLNSDIMRVKQILFNLVSNSCKFTTSGHIQIFAEEIVNGQEYQYSVRVKDTGIGLKETDFKDLFTAFTQAELSTTTQYGGTGLGLALSKQLVELLGGNIKVNSTYGKGSEFIIQLPKNYAG